MFITGFSVAVVNRLCRRMIASLGLIKALEMSPSRGQDVFLYLLFSGVTPCFVCNECPLRDSFFHVFFFINKIKHSFSNSKIMFLAFKCFLELL